MLQLTKNLFVSLGYGSNSRLDECHFHDCVKLSEFKNNRMLVVRPPEGEVSAFSSL